jgi:hypothetical protein
MGARGKWVSETLILSRVSFYGLFFTEGLWPFGLPLFWHARVVIAFRKRDGHASCPVMKDYQNWSEIFFFSEAR